MKKLLASTMLLLTSTLFTSTALADSHDIEAQYTIYHQSVVSVDVVWGSLEFDYTPGTTKAWNPVTHEFDATAADPKWQSRKEGESNVIQITNHSDTPITYQTGLIKNQGFKKVLADFNPRGFQSLLPAAEGSAAGRSASIVMELSGTVNQEFDTDKVGTVSLLITAGLYCDRSGKEYHDISGVQGGKMLLAAARVFDAAPTDENIKVVTGSYSKGNRFIRQTEVDQALARLEQSDSFLYSMIKDSQALYCEDGLLTFGSDPLDRCIFVEVMEVDLT